MDDTTTITAEERARLRELADKSYLLPLDEGEVPSVGFDGLTDDRVAYIAAACNSVPRLLTALEAAALYRELKSLSFNIIYRNHNLYNFKL